MFGGTILSSWRLRKMKPITLRLAVATLTFTIGVTFAALLTVTHYSSNTPSQSNVNCVPKYSPNSANEDWHRILDRFQETPLAEPPACVDESYRLIWIPTFHSPLSVRIWRAGEKQFLVTKQLDGKGGYGMGHLAHEEFQSLSDDEWNEFMRLLRRSGCWDLPSVDDSPSPNDGSTWVIEGVYDRKQHQVNRHSPSGEFRAACLYLVSLSGLKTEIERY
jgi:hypothetical protein